MKKLKNIWLNTIKAFCLYSVSKRLIKYKIHYNIYGNGDYYVDVYANTEYEARCIFASKDLGTGAEIININACYIVLATERT